MAINCDDPEARCAEGNLFRFNSESGGMTVEGVVNGQSTGPLPHGERMILPNTLPGGSPGEGEIDIATASNETLLWAATAILSGLEVIDAAPTFVRAVSYLGMALLVGGYLLGCILAFLGRAIGVFVVMLMLIYVGPMVVALMIAAVPIGSLTLLAGTVVLGFGRWRGSFL